MTVKLLQCIKTHLLHQPQTDAKHTEVSKSAFNNFNKPTSTAGGQGEKGTDAVALHHSEHLSFRRRTTFFTSQIHLALQPGLENT